MAHPIVNPNAPYADYILNADRIREFRMQVSETGPETPEEIIVGMTVLIARWVPIAIADPLVRAWFAADTSPRMLPHMEALRYANGSNRLDAALCLALFGNVVYENPPADWIIQPQPGAWIVQGSRYASYYVLNGTSCDCPDNRAPVINGLKACKHQLAVWLMKKAGLKAVTLPPEPTLGASVCQMLKRAEDARNYEANITRHVAA